MEVQS